ncbi:hypothetical protein GQ457_08G012350 [Hibiscus cannabinus]
MATTADKPVATASTAAAPSSVEEPAPPSTDKLDPPCSDTPASEISPKESEGSKTSGTMVSSVAGDGSGPVNDTQKKIRRAERFGLPVKLSEQEKRNSRAERFGAAPSTNGSEASKQSEDLKRKARAERFGLSVPSKASDVEAKKKARLARFAPESKLDTMEEEKRKARAIRFSNPPSSTSSQANGKGNIEPVGHLISCFSGGSYCWKCWWRNLNTSFLIVRRFSGVLTFCDPLGGFFTMRNVGLSPNKHGKEDPIRTYSFQSVKYPGIGGSMGELSYNEHVARYSHVSSEANCATMGTSGGEGGVEITESDVEAAVTLMELSNDPLCLPMSNLQTPARNGVWTNGSSLSQLKKTAERTCMGRQVEVDYHCIMAEKVLDDYELPISSLKRKKLCKSSSGKCGVKKVKAQLGSFGGSEVANSVQEPILEPFKKLQFGPRCPTAHPGFSFSIIHFLSAIRTTMTTPYAKDDPSASGNNSAESNPKSISRYHCLPMSAIVERVRLNPGDPCILEAREPLQELVRGALAIFSSTTAPLGAKDWKALTVYSKCDKSWSWIGPLSIKPHNDMHEAISSEAWGLPSRTVLKLVNCFADWLKIAQENLQKIGSLPAPPLTLMHQTINVTERLREIQPRKTVATISPCPEEIRDYFRKEEAVRYIFPERAFSYTTLDGRKSTVAPLRRCSGKPSSKCREHFMLKADRPPNITVLSVVRDAAARLPDRVGTRADICVLVRDSQYIVEEISDDQLNQVVSGALDRLHYEQDPCVRFNAEKKLWFYLHGDREEDDFEYDATLSTKKRRR